MREAECDVLVAGGGPAGAWAARILALNGWSVALWDRETFPRDKACGEYVSPGAVALLRAGGAGPALDRLNPARLRGARIFASDGTSFTGSFQPEDGPGLSLRRLHLDAMLLGLARDSGACVFGGTRFRAFARQDGCVVAEGRRDGEPVTLRCRALIGADGGHSAVARTMGGVRPIPRLGKVAFVTHARGIAGMEDRVEMHAGIDGCVGLGPEPDGAANVTVVMAPGAARDVRDVPEAVRQAVERAPGLRGRFDEAEWDDRVLRVGTFGHTVERAVADGVLLVGDAATFIDPFTGEGIYFALRGAEMAADRLEAALRSGDCSAGALAPYERDRRAEFAKKYLLCRVVERVVTMPRPMRFIARRLRARPALADDLIRTTGDILDPARVLSAAFWSRLLL